MTWGNINLSMGPEIMSSIYLTYTDINTKFILAIYQERVGLLFAIALHMSLNAPPPHVLHYTKYPL
jgi:hypothetical protein